MSQTLTQYLDWLDERQDLLWPAPPAFRPLKATPTLKPLHGIRLVTFNPYGTLLHIDQGRLVHLHPQKVRTQIALEKTINEFNMWNSMSRKPGQPWEYMLQQYTKLLEERQMAGTGRKGDYPEIDSTAIWHKVVERLRKNEYQYDEDRLGDPAELAEKVAYFFHASMQGVAASTNAVATLLHLQEQGIRCGLLGDGQSFTVPQIMRAFRQQRSLASPGLVLSNDSLILSTQVGLRQPSPGLYEHARDVVRTLGIQPGQVLHVSHRHEDDLVLAKAAGFRCALYAADEATCLVEKAKIRDPELRPDRLITDLKQLRDILQV
ncbi:MAG: HAD family hydrolase, partial [Planctomycetaceae bacterium]|nr:HAD family hydrolase [Planctomycetaceae bacterium]